MLDVGSWMLDVGCWMLDVGCWMLDVGCWMLDVGSWMLDVGCWMLDVFLNSKMAFVRALFAHGFRPALCPRRHGGRGARKPWLAGLANFSAHSRRNGLRAHLRHELQS